MEKSVDLVELIDSIDILDYISQFADFEEKNGEYWALSPLKDENTPSFSVRKETNSFFDFSSGIGGNVLTFTRYYFHCGYAEAIEKLMNYAGVDGISAARPKLAAIEVAKRFTRPKKASKTDKGVILQPDCMDQYLKDEDKMEVWEREGISRASLERFQVRYDDFSNRLVYPIRDPAGRIVNIGGRTLDPAWKEKKLRKYTYFFGWGEMKTIYGYAENLTYIKQKGEIILFEGCKSVLLADTWGIRNTGAILTSHLNQNQMKLLAQLGCTVVFALDKDVRIRDDHNIQQLKQYVRVEYIWDGWDLLNEKDSPVDQGLETFKTLYDRRFLWK